MKRTQTYSNSEQTPANWRLVHLVLLLLIASLAWSGCKQKVAGVADVPLAGTYTLASIDGKQVPCTVIHEGASPTIKSGTFIINEDGTCSSKLLFSLPGGGDSGREVKATYKRERSKLTMQWAGAGVTTGTVEGDTFTMNNEGMVFAYRK